MRKTKLMVWMGNNPSGSRPKFFGRQHLTFDKGRAWMPEVERPEFRKDAKQAESSYGKCGCARRGDSAVLGRVGSGARVAALLGGF